MNLLESLLGYDAVYQPYLRCKKKKKTPQKKTQKTMTIVADYEKQRVFSHYGTCPPTPCPICINKLR